MDPVMVSSQPGADDLDEIRIEPGLTGRRAVRAVREQEVRKELCGSAAASWRTPPTSSASFNSDPPADEPVIPE
jgi:hypothetical protein